METANTLVIGFLEDHAAIDLVFHGSKPRHVQYWWF
jgi:hypothetical protein